jgi:flagellar secretion chaperone FliS
VNNTALRNRYQSDGVASISQERLLLAIYDRLLVDLERATTDIGARRPAGAHEHLVHAQELLHELRLALDPSWEGTPQLASLYEYAIERLVEANMRKDAAPVTEVAALVAPLASTWREAYEQLSGARVGGFGGTEPNRRPATTGGRFEFGA